MIIITVAVQINIVVTYIPSIWIYPCDTELSVLEVDEVMLPVPNPASFEKIPRWTPIIKLPKIPPYADFKEKADLTIFKKMLGNKVIFLIATNIAMPTYKIVINGTNFSEKAAIFFKPPNITIEVIKTKTIPIINGEIFMICKKDLVIVLPWIPTNPST